MNSRKIKTMSDSIGMNRSGHITHESNPKVIEGCSDYFITKLIIQCDRRLSLVSRMQSS
jgi:hypothetical protein